MAIEDHYKYLQRRISKCGCVDSLYVIWAYSQFMQVRGFRFPDNIEKQKEFLAGSRVNFSIHEWELEIIAREAILHASRGTKTMRDWSTLFSIVRKLRQLENELYGNNQSADILVEVSRIMHRQIPWQQFRPKTKQVYRYYRIFSDPAIDAICRKVVGLSVDDLYYQGVAAYGHFANAPALAVDGVTSPPTPAFLAFAARPLAELRKLVGAAHILDDSYAYQLGPLRRYPLIKVANDDRTLVLCPIPTLLFWRMTTGLYYDLISGDRDFGNALGASFERYIGEVLARAVTSPQLRCIGEAKYGTKKRPKATPEWLLVEGDTAAAFIDCKAKRMRAAAKAAMGDLRPLEEDIGKLAEAIVQIYERLSEHAAGLFPNLAYAADRKCYPVVVTLEEWYMFGHRPPELLRNAVAQQMRDAGVDLGWLERAPYTVMSADTFEDAAQIINEVGISACFEGKLSKPAMRGWMFGDYLREQFNAEWKARRFLFGGEAEAMFSHLSGKATEAAA